MKKTFEFTEQEAELLRKEQYKYLINDNMDHFLFLVQQIVSERITKEPETIKPYHEHGNSVASDRTEPGESGQINAKWDELERTFNNKPFAPIDSTESGQSADGGIAIMEILQPIHRHPFDAESGREMEIWYTHKDVWNAMTTYASQVSADKDRENWKKIAYYIMNRAEGFEVVFLKSELVQCKSELAKANESLTVMIRKNAELEKELEYAKIR